ncbi:MAG: deoxyribonuclease V [Planctomycetota bacterium]|nr:deoxyribonuclease V [Planctomycetota bacterium]
MAVATRTPTPKEAVQIQKRLAVRVVRRTTFRRLDTVAGVDISVKNDEARAAVVVLAFPGMEIVETATAVRPIEFPYVPGLLGFREVPAIAEAYEKLAVEPDLLLVDGHGLAHPRRFGVACYVGVELGRPAIGCGKSLLVGEHRDPAARRGSRTRLEHRGEVIGAVLRTRDGVKPIYVSIGHRVDLPTAVKIVLRCARRYRLPEPIRAADRIAGLIP